MILENEQKIKVQDSKGNFEYGSVITLRAYCEKSGRDFDQYVEKNKDRVYLDGSRMKYAWGTKLTLAIDNSGHSYQKFLDYKNEAVELVAGAVYTVEGKDYTVTVHSHCSDFVHFIPVV